MGLLVKAGRALDQAFRRLPQPFAPVIHSEKTSRRDFVRTIALGISGITATRCYPLEDVQVNMRLGDRLYDRGEFEEAIKRYRMFLAESYTLGIKDNQTGRVHENIFTIYKENLGRSLDAIREAKIFIEEYSKPYDYADPGHEWLNIGRVKNAYFFISETYADMEGNKYLKEAIDWLKQILKKYQGPEKYYELRAKTYNFIAQLYEAQNNYNYAVIWHVDCSKLFSKSDYAARSTFRTAHIYERLNFRNAALSWYMAFLAKYAKRNSLKDLVAEAKKKIQQLQ